MKIKYPMDNIEVKGHYGRWYVIEKNHHPNTGEDIFLLEHETYGDEVPCVIVDKDGETLLEEVWNGMEDFFEHIMAEVSKSTEK